MNSLMTPLRRGVVALTALAVWSGLASTLLAADRFDWDLWRALPVQQGGRHKPLDTLAHESLRNWSNRGSIVDPQSGERLDPTALYVTLLFEWQGWDHPERRHLELAADWRPLYVPLHTADRWDKLPLLRIEDPTLRDSLSIELEGNLIAPEQLSVALIQDYRRNRDVPFTVWAEGLMVRDAEGQELAEIESKGLELAQRLWSYQNHRMARGLQVLPNVHDADGAWMPLADLLLPPKEKNAALAEASGTVQSAFAAARHAFHQQDAANFNRESQRLITALQQLGAASGAYPEAGMIQLEVAFNEWKPFRIAWALMLIATVGCLLAAGTGRQTLYRVAFAAYCAGLVAMMAGFAMRGLIAGRPPVTNMYESIVYVGSGVALLGLVFELINHPRFILATAATIATFVLILADCDPLVLDPGLHPLEPVLRSNFWLVTHVLTITLSYAALALALGLGNLSLGYGFARSSNHAAVAAIGGFTYKVLQFGVLLLSAGIMLGAVWADYSWGRFWGWDPKEVWALVALLGYLAVLHARHAGWVGDRGLAALAVVCFTFIVMGWYGVNFVLGVGLHTYGFGGGGQRYVYAGVVLQLLYVAIAVLRSPDSDRDQPATAMIPPQRGLPVDPA